VVEVVVVGAGPERENVLEGPGEVISGVGINGLEETENDPDVDSDNVQFLEERDVEEGST